MGMRTAGEGEGSESRAVRETLSAARQWRGERATTTSAASTPTTQQDQIRALKHFNVGEDYPVFDGLYSFCQSYAGGCVKLNHSHDIAINALELARTATPPPSSSPGGCRPRQAPSRRPRTSPPPTAAHCSAPHGRCPAPPRQLPPAPSSTPRRRRLPLGPLPLMPPSCPPRRRRGMAELKDGEDGAASWAGAGWRNSRTARAARRWGGGRWRRPRRGGLITRRGCHRCLVGRRSQPCHAARGRPLQPVTGVGITGGGDRGHRTRAERRRV
nr:uncharacterized protein LOC112939317 [Oryza sativa Japonica Group]